MLKKTEEKIFKSNYGITSQEMIDAGLHFGHKVSKCHPKMKKFLLGVRNTIHIIDSEKVAHKFEEALDYIKEVISEGKVLMIVGTKVQAKGLVKEIAEKYDFPYVSERWLGGTFTNLSVIKKRTDYFKDLEKKKIEKELEKYTKKERIKIDRELENLERKFGGIRNLEKIPEAILILDIGKDEAAVKEARKKGVKIIGIVDTNINPDLVDYPIFANDDSLSSIKYILEKVDEAIERGQKEAKKETN